MEIDLPNYYNTLMHLIIVIEENPYNLEKSLIEALRACTKAILNDVHIFAISNEVSELLLDTENKIRKDKTPYSICYIESTIHIPSKKENQEWKIHGICLFQKPGTDEIYFVSVGERTDGKTCLITQTITGKTKTIKKGDPSETDQITEKLRLYITNFLDFMNNPETEWIDTRGRAKTPEKTHATCPYCGRRFANNDALNRHIDREHEDRLPKIRICRLTGKTKRYVEQYKRLGKITKRHIRKHWVRGHYRHLRSPCFTHKQGQKIWIPPHLRGDGLFIPKTYTIEKPKGGVRQR